MTRAPIACARGQRRRERIGRRIEVAALDVDPHPVGHRVCHLGAVADLGRDVVGAGQLAGRLVVAAPVEGEQGGVVDADREPLAVAQPLPDLDRPRRTPRAAASGCPASRSTSPRLVSATAIPFVFPSPSLSDEALDEHRAGEVEVAAEVVDAAQRVERERDPGRLADPAPDLEASDTNASAASRSPLP